MKVWILQTGEPLQIDTNGLRPMRAINLSNLLIEKGHEVVIWSSDFDHFSKIHRYGYYKQINYSQKLQINLIPSRGYKSHIGLSRLIDHAQLGINLWKLLRTEVPPDVAFIGYPPIETAWVMSAWLRRRKVPSMLDVKDAWPEVLLRAFPLRARFIGRFILLPYFILARNTFKNVRSISAPTQNFLDWCLKKSLRKANNYDIIAPLTSPDQKFSDSEIIKAERWLDDQGIYNDKTLRISFIGTMNSAFDFDPIIDAAKRTNAQFIIAGDGPQSEKVREKTSEIKNVIMPGWITSVQAQVLSKRSSMLIAPFNNFSDFNMSLTNKFYDAMANSRGMLTSISGSAGEFIVENNIGLKYSNSDTNSLVDIISNLTSNDDVIKIMSANARKLYEDKFLYIKVYSSLVISLEVLANNEN